MDPISMNLHNGRKLIIKPIEETVTLGETRLKMFAKNQAFTHIKNKFEEQLVINSKKKEGTQKQEKFAPIPQFAPQVACQLRNIIEGDRIYTFSQPTYQTMNQISYILVKRAVLRQNWKQAGHLFLPSPNAIIRESRSRDTKKKFSVDLSLIFLEATLREDICTLEDIQEVLSTMKGYRTMEGAQSLVYRIKLAEVLQKRGKFTEAEQLRKEVLNSGNFMHSMRGIKTMQQEKLRIARIDCLSRLGIAAYNAWLENRDEILKTLAIDKLSISLNEDPSYGVSAAGFDALFHLLSETIDGDQLRTAIESFLSGWEGNPRPVGEAAMKIVGTDKSFRPLHHSILKAIVKRSPYDPECVIELVSLEKKLNGDTMKTSICCLKSLCNCLDNPDCGNSVQLWSVLAHVLRTLAIMAKREQLPLEVYDIFSCVRLRSWLRFYFSSNRGEPLLLGLKAFACWMMLPDSLGNDFVSNALKVLPRKHNLPSVGNLEGCMKQMTDTREEFQRQVSQTLEEGEEEVIPLKKPLSNLQRRKRINSTLMRCKTSAKARLKTKNSKGRHISPIPKLSLNHSNPRILSIHRIPDYIKQLPNESRKKLQSILNLSTSLYEHQKNEMKLRKSAQSETNGSIRNDQDLSKLQKRGLSTSLSEMTAKDVNDQIHKSINSLKPVNSFIHAPQRPCISPKKGKKAVFPVGIEGNRFLSTQEIFMNETCVDRLEDDIISGSRTVRDTETVSQDIFIKDDSREATVEQESTVKAQRRRGKQVKQSFHEQDELVTSRTQGRESPKEITQTRAASRTLSPLGSGSPRPESSLTLASLPCSQKIRSTMNSSDFFSELEDRETRNDYDFSSLPEPWQVHLPSVSKLNASLCQKHQRISSGSSLDSLDSLSLLRSDQDEEFGKVADSQSVPRSESSSSSNLCRRTSPSKIVLGSSEIGRYTGFSTRTVSGSSRQVTRNEYLGKPTNNGLNRKRKSSDSGSEKNR